MTNTSKKLIIYTDGSSKTDGSGGYGIYIDCKDSAYKLYGGFPSATNNQMELFAAIRALENFKYLDVKSKSIVIHSDSDLLCKGMNSWISGWKSNNWKGSNKKEVKNVEYWKRLDEVVTNLRSSKVSIEFKWVKAHSGIEGNEMADKLADLGTRAVQLTRVPFESWLGDVS